MKLNGLRRLWTALAIIPLLPPLAAASGSVAFVCRGDSVARVESCCPGGQNGALAGSIGNTPKPVELVFTRKTD